MLLSAFELSLDINFAMNNFDNIQPATGENIFKNCKAFFVFGNVILGISEISFDNSMQWMNKMRIQFGRNVEIYIVDKLNFPREKNCLAFFV